VDEHQIGGNIRILRQRATLTLTELARRAKITKSTLSKIETGQISSPVSTLLRIADALEAPMSEFFIEEKKDPPFVLTRKGQGRMIARDGSQWGYSYEALALGMKRRLCEPFLLTIRPGDPVGRFQHGGQEFIYMLSGRMEFTVDGTALRLGAGDALYLDPTHLHTTRVIGKQPVRFICIFMQNMSTPRRKKTS
jgi:transcriptional regulator with XRE-family HTH domain